MIPTVPTPAPAVFAARLAAVAAAIAATLGAVQILVRGEGCYLICLGDLYYPVALTILLVSYGAPAACSLLAARALQRGSLARFAVLVLISAAVLLYLLGHTQSDRLLMVAPTLASLASVLCAGLMAWVFRRRPATSVAAAGSRLAMVRGPALLVAGVICCATGWTLVTSFSFPPSRAFVVMAWVVVAVSAVSIAAAGWIVFSRRKSGEAMAAALAGILATAGLLGAVLTFVSTGYIERHRGEGPEHRFPAQVAAEFAEARLVYPGSQVLAQQGNEEYCDIVSNGFAIPSVQGHWVGARVEYRLGTPAPLETVFHWYEDRLAEQGWQSAGRVADLLEESFSKGSDDFFLMSAALFVPTRYDYAGTVYGFTFTHRTRQGVCQG